MKILSLHVDYIKFKPLKKALRSIASLTDKEKEGGHVKDALAILTSVEKTDSDVGKVVSELVKNIKEIAGQVNVKNIVLYPYAHLSNNLASPEKAIEVLDKAEKELAKDFNVTKAPFGYYKEFEMKVKGHPLSGLSREIMFDNRSGLDESYDPKQLLREISKSKLDISKLKSNDHRIVGSQMDLFSFNELAPGMVFWHNNGLIIKNELIDFWREVHRKQNYQEISTPQILDSKLWKISGHWEKYKENIFLTNYEKRQFAAKPMNCPGGVLVYKTKPKSYRDLPLRMAELGVVHRQELSGVLGGLFRVIQFTQDDAHIFCTEEQLENEISDIISLINLHVGLSNRLTMKDNIYLICSFFGLSIFEIHKKFREIVAFSELNNFLDTKIYKFSEGMKQRLAFSIAINCDPDILLVDEVFSVVDLRFKEKCNKHIKELIKNGVSIILVGHDLGYIGENCNRILLLQDGIILKEGNFIDVLKIYRSLNLKK